MYHCAAETEDGPVVAHSAQAAARDGEAAVGGASPSAAAVDGVGTPLAADGGQHILGVAVEALAVADTAAVAAAAGGGQFSRKVLA